MIRIGVPKEIKNNENRVALTPDGAARLVAQGHNVQIETQAGSGSGFSDAAYQQAGAAIVDTATAWASELVVKVKEPLPSEYAYLNGQMLFTYLHLSGVTRTLTEALLAAKVTGIAYETLEDEQGRLPLLAPMSAVAGNMATLMGAYYLARFNQGSGVLLGQVLGQNSGRVLVIGGGVVGLHAAKVACAMGANVSVAVKNLAEIQRLQQAISQDVTVILSSPESIAAHICEADLVVGAVLCPGEKASKVVTEAMVKTMKPGSVLVDVSIDQGGCFETSQVTTHAEPVFIKHGVTHYCVANMPGAYPRTSTIALTNATIGYIEKIAAQGLACLAQQPGLIRAINTYQGYITHAGVAKDLDLLAQYSPFFLS